MNLYINKKVVLLIFSLLIFIVLMVGCTTPVLKTTNQAPIITSTPITSATVNQTYAYKVDATDPDGDTLIYSLTIKPRRMAINLFTGLINWTPTSTGDYDVTVIVNDGRLFTTQSFTIHVREESETTNQAPIITSTPVTSAAVNQTYAYKVDATDLDGDTLIYSLTIKPRRMAINLFTGLINWTPTSTGDYNVIVRVSDGRLFTTQSFTIHVREESETTNQAPIIISTPVTSAAVNQTYAYKVDATDPDGDTLIYSLTTKPMRMAINLFTGLINWTPTSTGDYDVTVRVSDGKLFTSQSFTITVSEALPTPPTGGAKWTIMVYMDGDNNLDDCAWDDLSELESVSSTDEIKIVTQLDAYYSCSGTFRYYITGAAQGASYPLYPDDIVQTLPEQNMADPATLTSFVNWAIANYPAEKYLLVLWNHGAGWRDRNIPTKGIIMDDTSGDFMTMAELVQGLNGVNEGLDIIGFDACLMQMAEVAYEINGLTNVPNYMVGSQASEWGDGWPYDDILAHLLANPGMTERVFCEIIVNDFINYCGFEGTLSTLDFSAGTHDTYTALNSFATALMASSYQDEIAAARSSAQSYSYSSGYRCKDIYDFAERIRNSVPDCRSEAQAVMNQVNDLVLFEAHTGSGVTNSHGLSIYLPDNASEYDNDYNDLQFAIDTQWDEFLQGGGVVPPSSSVYRAFLVGVGDYQYFPDVYGNIDLPAPPFDVERMHDILSHSGSGFSLIDELTDLQATKAAILNGIANAFSRADSDDVFYFYFSGHGMYYNGVSYLCPTDVSYYSPLGSYISTNELESALSAIPGTKVVILDCCHSGGFIGKQIGEEEISTNPQEFNDNVINVFLSRDLTSSQYKVLTSCLSSQVCVELIPAEGDPFGLFSGVLCEGCGYNYYTHPYFADGNGNGEITLHEAYTYTYETVNAVTAELNYIYGWNIDQDTQVYPLYSDFVIIEE